MKANQRMNDSENNDHETYSFSTSIRIDHSHFCILRFANTYYLSLRTQAGLGADCKLFSVKLMRAGGQPVLQIITTLMMDPAPQGISLRGYGKRSETQVMEYVCCVPKTLF